MKCKECGMKIEEGERYCGFCGQRIARKDVKEEIAEIELESGKDFDDMTPNEIFEVMMNQKRKEKSRKQELKDESDDSEGKRIKRIIYVIVPIIVFTLYIILELFVFKGFFKKKNGTIELELAVMYFGVIMVNLVLNYKLYF